MAIDSWLNDSANINRKQKSKIKPKSKIKILDLLNEADAKINYIKLFIFAER